MIPTQKHLGALLLGVMMSFGLAAVLLVPYTARAQAVSGDITGVVTDANKSVIVKANVVAKNTATSVAYSAVTNAVGEYHLTNLPPGTYDLTVSAVGFSKSVMKGFEVELNKVSTANVALKVVSATETVEVSAAGVSLDTTTAQLETSFTSEQLTELPAASNNVLNLSLMTAGVSSSGGVGQGTGPSIGGQRPTDNNYMVEGIDNNDKSVPGPLLYVPSDAVAEFTSLQNQYSAEYGHSNGGQFNQIIKSGTNQFHGVVYEYSQNRNYNAIDAAQARAQRGEGITNPKNPRYDDNRFGGQVGGPILKNKLFFFSNYEQEPYGAPGATASFCAPTAAGFATLGGISSLASNNLAVYKKYSPVASSQASATDAICPTTVSVAGNDIPVGDVGVSSSTYLNQYRSINSVDYTISDKDSLRVRYLFNRTDGPDTAATFQSFWTVVPNRFHLATFSEFHTFAPTLSNEFRLGYNRFYNITPASGAFPGMTVFPNITLDDLNGVNIGPDPNAPQATIQNTYQGSDALIWNRGKHTIKAGLEYRDVISPQLFVQRARGDYEWSTLEGYLQDVSPDTFGERNATAPGVSPTYYGNQKVIYSYFNDDFRVSQALTLNLGIRYEFTGVPLGEQTQKANIAASVPGLITFGAPKSQKLNFVPRVGFAYSVDPKTVVRGGFGMGYDVLYDNLGTLAAAPQYQITEDVQVAGVPGFLAGGGLPANVTIPDLATQRALTTAYVPDQKLPYAENWSVGIERTFAQNYTAEIRYMGTRGIHLPTQNRINRQSIVTGTNQLPVDFTPTVISDPTALTLKKVQAAGKSFVPAYTAAGFQSSIVAFMPWSESNYNGLATQLNRRFAHGLLLNAAYTWSKNMDDATATAFSTYLTPRRSQDFRNIGSDYSRSALDHTHRLTVAVVYDLPFFNKSSWLEKNIIGNWEFAPVYTYQSPEYATVQSNVDANLNGDAAGDRVFINKAGKKGTGTGVSAYANPSLTGLCPVPTKAAPGTYDPNGTLLCSADTANYVANDPTAYYVAAGAGTMPTASRNTLPIRPINDVDLTALKRISFSDHYKFEIQAQMWNVLNHSQYLPGSINNINSVGYTDGGTHSYLIPGQPNFNDPEATFSNNARSMQLVAKFIF
ncbi:MAG TPA: TonB-dependent receptor [Terracidiphilus sp.]